MTNAEARDQWQNMRNAVQAFLRLGEVLDVAAEGEGRVETLKRQLAELAAQHEAAQAELDGMGPALTAARRAHAEALEALARDYAAKDQAAAEASAAKVAELQQAFERAQATAQERLDRLAAEARAAEARTAAAREALGEIEAKVTEAKEFLKGLHVAAG